MLSNNSVLNFFYINMSLFFLSTCQYFLIKKINKYAFYTNFCSVFILFLSRNIIMERSLNYFIKNKKFIGHTERNINENDKNMLNILYLTTTLVETITHFIISKIYIFSNNNIYYDLLLFLKYYQNLQKKVSINL